jgi:hypothetical protein
MRSTGLDRDTDIGTRQIDAAIGHDGLFRREIGERLPGQDDDVGDFAIAQAIEQRQRRPEIGIDARAAASLVSPRKAADRALQRQRREHANDIFHGGLVRATAWLASAASGLKRSRERVKKRPA